MISLDADIIIGNGAAIAGLLAWVRSLTKKIDLFQVEHEMLLTEYCERRGEKKEDLPTRTRRI